MMVESGGNINAVGDGGKAIGPFQLHEVYWQDAADYDPHIKQEGTYQNCKGEGSIEYSEKVMQVCTYVPMYQSVHHCVDQTVVMMIAIGD